MKSWTKAKEERAQTKLEKRVATLATSELLPWSEQAIYALGRNLSAWQRTQESFYIQEARTAAQAIHAITEELCKRTGNV